MEARSTCRSKDTETNGCSWRREGSTLLRFEHSRPLVSRLRGGGKYGPGPLLFLAPRQSSSCFGCTFECGSTRPTPGEDPADAAFYRGADPCASLPGSQPPTSKSTRNEAR